MFAHYIWIGVCHFIIRVRLSSHGCHFFPTETFVRSWSWSREDRQRWPSPALCAPHVFISQFSVCASKVDQEQNSTSRCADGWHVSQQSFLLNLENIYDMVQATVYQYWPKLHTEYDNFKQTGTPYSQFRSPSPGNEEPPTRLTRMIHVLVAHNSGFGFIPAIRDPSIIKLHFRARPHIAPLVSSTISDRLI